MDEPVPFLAEIFEPTSAVAIRRMQEDRAEVLSIDGTTALVAVAPEVGVHLSTGQEVELRAGFIDGWAWLVSGIVSDVNFTATGIAVVHLQMQERAQRFQQRRHVRIPAFDVELSLRIQRGREEREWFIGTGFDISAGGVRFTTNRVMRNGEVVDVRLHLPSAREPLNLTEEAVIVWSSGEPAAGRTPHYALRFTKMTRRTEDAIVAWVLERQTRHPH